jgi:hypothetical protein
MIGRRAAVGLSLLCALAFCAFAAQGASAKGTTAFTCAKVEPKTGKFADAHCDTGSSEGEFEHQAITETTELELSNAKTKNATTEAEPSVLSGILLGAEVRVECKTVEGTGSLTNGVFEGTMRTTGTMVIKHSACTVTKPSKCKVKEPITYNSKFTTYQNATEMGLSVTPASGTEFGSFTLEGAECPIKQTFGISGSFELTPGGTAEGKGATLWFECKKGTLKWGGNAYELTGAITLRRKGGGNPIVFTTTEP